MKPLRTDAPIAAMLRAGEGTVRFHMPGHKGLLSPDDVTELARTDDLYAPTNAIAEAERLAALSCGAARTLMLTGGSTAGLLAMILSTVSPGETLILPRDAHHAALSACVWGDVDAIFAADLSDGIDRHPTARAVLVTRPDYYGRCVDLSAIVEKAHAHGMLVLVDEAHGAHFSWWAAPRSAGRLGADAWVQSAHKTLPALTGAAWLHLSPCIDDARARRFLRMVQTSSPPFPILRSLDDARAWMDRNAAVALSDLQTRLAAFRARLAALGGYADASASAQIRRYCATKGISQEIPTCGDPTRLVIDTRGRGYSGLELQALLAERRIDIEMADDARLVCICTVFDTDERFDRLYDALATIRQKQPLPPISPVPQPPGERVLSVRQAVLSPQEAVPLAAAAGRVAAIGAGLYPPGIPIALPGEQITAACVDALSSVAPSRRFGVEHDCLICVK